MSNYEVIDINGVQCVKRTDADGKIWFIPADPLNSDYVQYLEDIAKK